MFIVGLEEKFKFIDAVNADPKLNVPLENVVGFPGTLTLLVEIDLDPPEAVNCQLKVAPENATLPAAQVTLPYTVIDGEVPVTKVTLPADTVQSKQLTAPVIVTL